MRMTVITPPEPVADVAEAIQSGVFASSDNSALIYMLLAAAQRSVDGPTGTLGSALGQQTLEFMPSCFHEDGSSVIRLPYPPITSIVSIKYTDAGGVEQTVSPSSYSLSSGSILPASGYIWPRCTGAPRIRYIAGYAADAVPESVTFAVIMMAGQLKSLSGAAVNGMLRKETVDGVGSFEYSVPEQAAAAIQRTANALLSPFKVYTL